MTIRLHHWHSKDHSATPGYIVDLDQRLSLEGFKPLRFRDGQQDSRNCICQFAAFRQDESFVTYPSAW